MTIDANAYPNSGSLVINQFLGIVADTESVSTNTGALQVLGGIGVAGNVTAANVYATNIVSLGNLSGIGFIFGNVVGNLTGNVVGNLTGNVRGNVSGNITGNVSGNITGNISAVTGTFQFLQVSNSKYFANSVVGKGYVDSVSIVFGI